MLRAFILPGSTARAKLSNMNLLMTSVCSSYAALCVWLMVRIMNRREKWAKRTFAVVLSLPLVYLLSFGPVCWITSRANFGTNCGRHVLPKLYQPIVSRMEQGTKCLELATLHDPKNAFFTNGM